MATLPNLLCDAVQQLQDQQEIADAISATTSSYLGMIHKSTKDIKTVLLAPPIMRSIPKWFSQHMPSVSTILIAHARTYSNMSVLPEYKDQATDRVFRELLSGSDGARGD